VKTERTDAEKAQIEHMLDSHDTFYKVFREDWTQKVIDELKYRLYGKIPRNFLINVGGLIGTPTGIFKSSMGLQIAIHLDPLFNLKERVAFSVNELLMKVETNSEKEMCYDHLQEFTSTYTGTYEMQNEKLSVCHCGQPSVARVLLTKMIFFLDEQTQTLKHGGLLRLQNIVDTVRQRQICFVTCGVDKYGFNYTTYSLQRVQESADKYLPKKRVRYAVHDSERDMYYGYFLWDITELSDLKWNNVWTEYSQMKQQFQRVALAQQISGMDYGEMAVKVMEDPRFQQCVSMKNGKLVANSNLTKNIILKIYPDLTNEDRAMILAEIRFLLNESQDENGQKDV